MMTPEKSVQPNFCENLGRISRVCMKLEHNG
jgi:hypothetical protein